MSVLIWDNIGSRRFETGLDRGVLYLSDGSGVAWSGLVSVSEKTSTTTEALYFDGRKFNDVVGIGDYSAELSAFTYPNEFSEIAGIVEAGRGISFYDQRLSRFGLSYRTKLGNDLQGPDAGYQIHVIYNLIAVVSEDIGHDSISDSVTPITFKWDISAVPIEVPGFEPVSHIVIDTTKSPSDIVTDLEHKLYGTASTAPILPELSYILHLATVGLV